MSDTDLPSPDLSPQEALAAARTVIEQIVWCTLATVGPDGAPRCRIVHPIWDWDTATGWITSRATPLRRATSRSPTTRQLLVLVTGT